ncbi:unnamed protein product [Rhizophagus irregularis]|nr:unnamed protein product [Rhizophagus irregularis]
MKKVQIHIFDQFVFLTMGNILFYVLLNNNSKLFQNYVKCITNDKNKYFSSEIRSTIQDGVAAWAKDKLVLWVLSDISSAFTKMDHTIWNQFPNNTNVGESVHANVNHDGRNLSLLAGIYRGPQSIQADKRAVNEI